MVKAKKKTNSELDLDALNPSIGEVKLSGKKYNVYQPGYEKFVLMPVTLDKLGESFELGEEEKQEAITIMKGLIQEVLPDLDEQVILKMTMPQLISVVDFVSAKFIEQVGGGDEGADKGKQDQDTKPAPSS